MGKLLLCSFLIDPDRIAFYMGDPRFDGSFDSDRDCYIYECMVECFLRDGTVDVISLAEELHRRKMLEYVGGAEYLASIVDDPI